MAEYVEVHGASLKNSREKEREADLHHLTIHAHSDATPESPKWIVAHHHSENDDRPAEHVFDDGHSMLRHIAEHAAVPPDDGRTGE
jgi:hypothetical protein